MGYEELLYDEEEEFEKIVPKVKELVRIDKKLENQKYFIKANYLKPKSLHVI